MYDYITAADLARINVRPSMDPALEFPDLVSLDPKDASNKDRFSIEEYWTDRILSKIKSNVSFFLNGDMGAGKSYTLITVGYNCAKLIAEKNGGQWSDYFGEDFIGIINPDRIQKVQAMKVRYACKVLDDLSVAVDSRDSLSKANKEHVHQQTVSRTDNNIVLSSSPDQMDVDKRLRQQNYFYGEIERNARAMSRGFTLVKIMKLSKNRRTGHPYYHFIRYTDKYHRSVAISLYAIGCRDTALKELLEWYDKERDKEKDRLANGDAKREMEEQKKMSKKTSRAKENAYQNGVDVYRLIDDDSLTLEEALCRLTIQVQTWRRWEKCGWVSRDLCHRGMT